MADEFYGKGITVTSGFDLSSKSPLDTRNVVNTIEERDAHVIGNRAYEGMKVYVLADKKEYRYNGTDWEVVGGLTDEQLNQLRAELNTKANLSDIPTKTSELKNDSTYVTESGVLEIIESSGGLGGGATEVSQGEIEPTEESVLLWIDTTSDENIVENNLSDALLSEFRESISNLNTRVTSLENEDPIFQEDIHSHSNKGVLDKITQSYFDKWTNKSEFNGSYNNLTDKPNLDMYATRTYVDTAIESMGNQNLDDYALKSELPTKTSDLTNDSGYLTSIPNEYVTETELNAKGYLTEHQDISNLATKSELNNKANLSDIPTKTSELTNDSNFATETFVTTKISESSLSGGGNSFSGSYNDLTDKPTIPTVTNDLTNELKANYDTAYTHSQSAHAPSNAQKNSDITKTEIEAKLTGNVTSHTHSQYLTEHQDISNLALKSELPTKTSDLTNDSGYLTSIPNEYVTETELTSKGYATETYVQNKISEISSNGGGSGNVNLDKYLPFEDGYVSNCNSWLTNGYTKTNTSTTNLPSVCVRDDRWGVLFFIAENAKKGTGTQMYFPIDGAYKGAIFTRAITDGSIEGSSAFGEWKKLVTTSDIPTKTSELTNDSGYLTSTNNTLETTDKTIVGAINEVNAELSKCLPFEDSYVSNCNSWLTNGYTKTNTSTTNHPSVCTGSDRWGIIFFIAENVADGTGTQMYFPIDGTYKGSIFTRSITKRSPGEWEKLATTSDIPTTLSADGGNADTVDNFHIWKGTQAQYNEISSKDNNTIYIIVG